MPVLPLVQLACVRAVPVRGVRLGAAVEPVDDGLRGLDVGAAADVDAAVGAVGAGEVDADEGVAARHEVVVVEERHLDNVAARVVRLQLALVAAAAAGVVGAGVHDDGDFAALSGGFARPDDVDGDPVGLSVTVAVESGVHPDGLADGLRVGVDGWLSCGALWAAVGVRKAARRAAIPAVASDLQIVKRVRFGMRGRYIGQLPCWKRHSGSFGGHDGRMAIV
jgi:hypothetical protein